MSKVETKLDRVMHLPGMDPRYEALFVDFAVGSHTLRKEHEDWLKDLGQRLMREESANGISLWGVTAVGYASQTGSRQANETLSIARAEAALDEYAGLIHRPHAMRPRFLGLGKDYPADPKVQENGRDRCVHFAVGPREMLLPAPPKTVDIDLAKEWQKENSRRHKLTIVVDDASETGVGISKILAGAGYSTIRINFTVTREGRGVGKQYTFMGGGFNIGWSLNPLPLDGTRTIGRGEPEVIYVHDTIDDDTHFLGKATVDQISEGIFLTYRGRSHHHRLVAQLKLPTQLQAPSVSLKQFNGSVRRGHLR